MDDIVYECIRVASLIFSAEVLTLFLYLFSCGVVVVTSRFYGVGGLWLYTALASIASNIQVLRFSYYSLTGAPFVLGTALFTSTFLVQDVLVERYGLAAAKKNISLSFWAQVVFLIWMMLTIAHPNPTLEQVVDLELYQSTSASSKAIQELFVPTARFLFASLAAFYISQWSDILIFASIKKKFNNRFLWIRQFLSMSIAGFIDSLIFSTLAWIILAPQPISWSKMFIIYCMGTQVQRIIFSLFAMPFIYMVKNQHDRSVNFPSPPSPAHE